MKIIFYKGHLKKNKFYFKEKKQNLLNFFIIKNKI